MLYLYLHLHQEDQYVSEYKKRQMYHSIQAVLFVATAYNLKKTNMRWQQVALEHHVSIHLRD